MMANPQVGIIMGSKNDLDIMQVAANVLKDFGVEHEIRVLSAHRTPKEAASYLENARERGVKVIIAGAGGSAHLGGVASAHTELPVLSIPVKREGHGHEALFSNVMMPPGVPLATMPENGGKNTGLFAVEILALSDNDLLKKYQEFRRTQTNKVLTDDQSIQ